MLLRLNMYDIDDVLLIEIELEQKSRIYEPKDYEIEGAVHP